MQALGGKMKKYKGWAISFLVLAIVGSAGSYYYYNKGHETIPTETTHVVSRGGIQSVVSATGTIKAVNTVNVGSRVTGLITEVKVRENDRVKKGQVLVVLDDTAIRAQVEQSQAQTANYAAVYERSKKIFAIGGESAQQLDSDRMNYQVAKANYNNFAAQLTYYVISAPIDGVVVGTPADVGSTVVQGLNEAQTVLTLAELDRMQIKVLVDESDIGKVKIGQTVSFIVDSYTDKVFTGKVMLVSKSAVSSSNVVYYPVYVDVDSPQDLLFPTMTARVTISVDQRLNVLVVPLSAIKEENGQKVVTLIKDGKKQSAPVQTGLSDNDNIEILSGLSEGSQIVISAQTKKTATNQNQGGPPPM